MKSGFKDFFTGPDSDQERDNTFVVLETSDAEAPAEPEAKPDVPPEQAGGDASYQKTTVVAPEEASSETEPSSPEMGTMVAHRDRVVASLLQKGLITPAHAREATNQWQRQGEQGALWRLLAEHPNVDRETVFSEAARIYAFRTIDVTANEPDPDFVQRVVESLTEPQRERLLSLQLLPLEYEIAAERGVLKLVFATHDPTRPETLRFIHDLSLDNFELCYAPESEITPLLDELFPRRNEYLQRVEEDEQSQAYDLGASYKDSRSQVVDEEALEAEINRSGLINLFEAALVEAVRKGVSDVHIFPNSNRQTEIHFRIDGQLQHWHTQDKVHPEAMLAVVKDRCLNVDRFDREIAQDGYIQRTIDDTLIRFRVSVLPIAGSNRDIKSESIVIRVLDDRNMFSDLSEIGLLPGALERFQKAVRQPYGMVIMTGPTGSGKSTTLVAALRQIVSPKLNVLSVEDPVEYIIPGVRQIKLGPRLHLETALRSILRHDPDVVMVGEMRDRPTAELAIKLANTGHLTFSTLHTNDAPSAISRLYKMGIEPFLIAYAINLVVAQRLIRTLCPECKQEVPTPDSALLHELGFSDEEIASTTFYDPGHRESCRTCKGLGYKGRRAISEAMYLSPAIRHLIVDAGGNIDEDQIRAKAIEEGLLTLLASAREVVKMGQTSIEEVIRVIATE